MSDFSADLFLFLGVQSVSAAVFVYAGDDLYKLFYLIGLVCAFYSVRDCYVHCSRVKSMS